MDKFSYNIVGGENPEQTQDDKSKAAIEAVHLSQAEHFEAMSYNLRVTPMIQAMGEIRMALHLPTVAKDSGKDSLITPGDPEKQQKLTNLFNDKGRTRLREGYFKIMDAYIKTLVDGAGYFGTLGKMEEERNGL